MSTTGFHYLDSVFPVTYMISVLTAVRPPSLVSFTAGCPWFGIISRLDVWFSSGDCVLSSSQRLLHSLVLKRMRTMQNKWAGEWLPSLTQKESENRMEGVIKEGQLCSILIKSKLFMCQIKEENHGAARSMNWEEGAIVNPQIIID